MGFVKRKEDKTIIKNLQDEGKNTTVGEILPCEEWVWVEGYKVTNYDMTCRGYQYTLGEEHSLPEGEDVRLCEKGFHFCLNKTNLYRFYDYGRVFKVKGLVKKEEPKSVKSFSPYSSMWTYPSPPEDKLVARSIVFLEELSPAETRKCFSKQPYVHTDEDWLEFLKLGYADWVKFNEYKLRKKIDLSDNLYAILTFPLNALHTEKFLEYCIALSDSGVSRDMFIYLITEKQKELCNK